MAETLVENLVCNHCGADVRLDTLFCYNCGSSVAPEVIVALKDKDDFTEPPISETVSADDNGDDSKQEAVAEIPIPKPGGQNETNLKSAAAMRRKPKAFQPKRVEVVWEANENSPNIWFIAAAILLTLFAVGVLYLALHLK